ncbi:MAG: hypothetical protein E5X54_23160 [Mesorhizobium sp.]|nr:MAG: hypothetical protein E5X54_23160 [Mesorhizobium sp.]
MVAATSGAATAGDATGGDATGGASTATGGTGAVALSGAWADGADGGYAWSGDATGGAGGNGGAATATGGAAGDGGGGGSWGSNIGHDQHIEAISQANANGTIDMNGFNQQIVMGANLQGHSVDMTVVGGNLSSSVVGEDDAA